MSFLILSFFIVNIFLAPPIIYNALANDQDMLSTSRESYLNLAQKDNLRAKELLIPTLFATLMPLTDDSSRGKLPSIAPFTNTVKLGVNSVENEFPNGVFKGVSVVNADTQEQISSAKSGDDFLFNICAQNTTYIDQVVTLSWIVRNPNGIYRPFTHELVSAALPAQKNYCWYMGRSEFPYNTIGGNWSFQGILHPSSTTRGGSEVKTVYVNNISQATPEPTQSPVFVRNVYLANNRSGQGSVSSVQAGFAFHPVIYWTNRASRKIPVSWTISISYNGQTILEEKGTRDADPGDRSWRMETFGKPDMVIPSGATPGRYLLRGTICKLPVIIDIGDCEAEESLFSVTSAPTPPPAPTQPPAPTPPPAPVRSEVIVFVHGWQGLSTQMNAQTAREQFGFVANQLERAGYPIFFAVLESSERIGTPSVLSNDINYNILKETISRAKRESGKPKVILIAHSMGGLIARRYVNSKNLEYAGDVSKLFTFGTPHEGIDQSIFEGIISSFINVRPINEYCNPGRDFPYQPHRDAACDFVFNIGEFNRLYPLRNDVNHYFISGNSHSDSQIGSYDRITPVYSGRASHLSAAFIQRLTTNESHVTKRPVLTGYFEENGQSWTRCIRPLLIDGLRGCDGGDDGTLPAELADNILFVRRQYRDFLGRVADDEGLAFWSDHLTRLRWNQARVVESIYNSDEVQNRGIAVIVRFYYAALYRRPDYDGLAAHTSSLYAEGNHTDNLYRRLGDIGMNFVDSSEFRSRYGNLDNKAFLVHVYRNMLNREPDEIGLQDWLRYLDSGHTRGEFLRDFVLAAEIKNRFRNETLVSTVYAAMLKCQASDVNYITWIKNLRSGWTAEAFINEVMKDKNYQNSKPCLG